LYAKYTSVFIGVGVIIPRVLESKIKFEIAYSLLPAFWEKGNITELAKHKKSFETKSIEDDRLVSISNKGNAASLNVAKKMA
jgi:hypothetical protein